MARTRRERERERERERNRIKLIHVAIGLLIAGKRQQQIQHELLLAVVMNDVLSRPATLTRLSEDLFARRLANTGNCDACGKEHLSDGHIWCQLCKQCHKGKFL